jgi:hypothetical protein
VSTACLHCLGPLTGRQQRRYCSRRCAGLAHTDLTPWPAPLPLVPIRRSDAAFIGAVFVAWRGAPILLAELAALIDEPNFELRCGLLRPWVEALISERGPVLVGRNEAYSDVRRYLDSLRVREVRTERMAA